MWRTPQRPPGRNGPRPRRALPQAAPAAAPAYSGTNDYVAGVDEPDLVKTDGRRIVTVASGVLEVIDAASRTVTGRLKLSAADGGMADQPANLLLSGDHALVLTSGGPVAGGAAGPGGSPRPVDGSRLLLIDLAGRPSVMSSYVIEGRLIDARQIGPAVRVVISSQPRLDFPAQPESTSNAQRVAANQAVVSHAGLDAWLPHYEETSGGATSTGHIACSAVSRPASYSGANLLTVLTFDLTSDALGSGDGVSIVADGNTVYGTDTSLYVAGDERRLAEASTADAGAGMPAVGAGSTPGRAARQQTDIYRFDITSPGPPRFAAGGSVPGYLIDQYALSEWQGYLRVATTTGTSWALADGPPADAQASSSAVYVLSIRGPVMRLAGHVTGLGRTERIYSVRFIGPVGYVVTFRQTDPLYTVDLSDPARPRVRGSVALTGYSAYLHPASGTRLIGIGRQADAMGHVGGTQVSLFDVSDLAAPTAPGHVRADPSDIERRVRSACLPLLARRAPDGRPAPGDRHGRRSAGASGRDGSGPGRGAVRRAGTADRRLGHHQNRIHHAAGHREHDRVPRILADRAFPDHRPDSVDHIGSWRDGKRPDHPPATGLGSLRRSRQHRHPLTKSPRDRTTTSPDDT